VFDKDGWIVKHLGALDFAGGLPVELNSGVAGLAVALVLRAPRDFARREERPDNIPLVVVGVGLLWFGWFGFNSGSALTDQGTAAAALIDTQLGAAGAMVTSPLVEKWRTGRVTTIGRGVRRRAGRGGRACVRLPDRRAAGRAGSGRRTASDDEPVQQITRPLRAREGEK